MKRAATLLAYRQWLSEIEMKAEIKVEKVKMFTFFRSNKYG